MTGEGTTGHLLVLDFDGRDMPPLGTYWTDWTQPGRLRPDLIILDDVTALATAVSLTRIVTVGAPSDTDPKEPRP